MFFFRESEPRALGRSESRERELCDGYHALIRESPCALSSNEDAFCGDRSEFRDRFRQKQFRSRFGPRIRNSDEKVRREPDAKTCREPIGGFSEDDEPEMIVGVFGDPVDGKYVDVFH